MVGLLFWSGLSAAIAEDANSRTDKALSGTDSFMDWLGGWVGEVRSNVRVDVVEFEAARAREGPGDPEAECCDSRIENPNRRPSISQWFSAAWSRRGRLS